MDYITLSSTKDIKVITLGPYYPKDVGKEDFFSRSILSFKAGKEEVIDAFTKLMINLLKQEKIKGDKIITVLGSKEVESNTNSPLYMLGDKLAAYTGISFDSRLVFQKSVRNPLKDAGSYLNRINILRNNLICEKNLHGEKIIVIDDVTTTGATINTYSKLLKDNNAGMIVFITLGKSYHEDYAYWQIPAKYYFDAEEFKNLSLENNVREKDIDKQQLFQIEQLVFPNKTLYLAQYYAQVFKKYYDGLTECNAIVKQCLSNTSTMIPKIEYAIFKTIEAYIKEEKGMVTIYDDTFSYGAVYFALIDLLYCLESYSSIKGSEVKQICFSVYFSTKECFYEFKKLLIMHEEIMTKGGYVLRAKVKCFLEDLEKRKYDLIVSEDHLNNKAFDQQIIFLNRRTKISKEVLKEFLKVSELNTVLKASIKDIVNEKRELEVRIKGYFISNVANIKGPEIVRLMNPKREAITSAMEVYFYRVFGFPHFSKGQEKIIERIFSNRGVLGLLPTGGGKSICFQFPAIVSSGLTIVICPLRSLMIDQCSNLISKGINCVEYIDASLDDLKKKKVFKRIREQSVKLLYISPERLLQAKFKREIRDILKITEVKYFVIDEAHCVSEWGHDFRPSYLMLNDFIRDIGKPLIIALTATASKKVQSDILKLLELEEGSIIKNDTLDRPELSFDVVKIDRKHEKLDFIYKYLKEQLPVVLGYKNLESLHKENSGLVFTIYANASNELLKPFSSEYASQSFNQFFKKDKMNLASDAYHSKLKDSKRITIQNSYSKDEVALLVATKGFGMGVDKKNIRYVLHLSAPPSLEAYYQEGGRAGRDKMHSHCVIFYYPMDKKCSRLLKDNKINKIPCIRGGGCSCSKGGYLCDIGAQLKLYLLSPACNIKSYIKTMRWFYLSTLKRSEENCICALDGDKKEILEKMLCDFKKIGLIASYEVGEYKDDFNKEYIIYGISKCGRLELRRKLSYLKIKLQQHMKMKADMLYTMHLYMEGEDESRREFMLTYFQSSEKFQTKELS